MDKAMNERFSKVTFNFEQYRLFSEILRQDKITLEIFNLIADRAIEMHNDKTLVPVTIKEISETIQVERKVGVKPRRKNDTYKFEQKNGYISRKMAEGIVHNLQFASLVYFEEKKRAKHLIPTTRGLQLHVVINALSNLENGLITEEQAQDTLKDYGIL